MSATSPDTKPTIVAWATNPTAVDVKQKDPAAA